MCTCDISTYTKQSLTSRNSIIAFQVGFRVWKDGERERGKEGEIKCIARGVKHANSTARETTNKWISVGKNQQNRARQMEGRKREGLEINHVNMALDKTNNCNTDK